MAITREELSRLRNLKRVSDDDNILYKKIIENELKTNDLLIHCLHNETLSEDQPDDYFGTVIKPYYYFSSTVTDVKNYICYTVGFEQLVTNYSNLLKVGLINFYVICANEDIVDSETGIPRHDLLAYIIKDKFNWTNIFGLEAILTSDVELIIDQNFICRQLTYEIQDTNSIVRTKNGVTSTYRNGGYN